MHILISLMTLVAICFIVSLKDERIQYKAKQGVYDSLILMEEEGEDGSPGKRK
jgi:hypothetical protein